MRYIVTATTMYREAKRFDPVKSELEVFMEPYTKIDRHYEGGDAFENLRKLGLEVRTETQR